MYVYDVYYYMYMSICIWHHLMFDVYIWHTTSTYTSQVSQMGAGSKAHSYICMCNIIVYINPYSTLPHIYTPTYPIYTSNIHTRWARWAQAQKHTQKQRKVFYDQKTQIMRQGLMTGFGTFPRKTCGTYYMSTIMQSIHTDILIYAIRHMTYAL
jgi:hypothetical protein